VQGHNPERDNVESIIIIMAIIACAGWIGFSRWRGQRASAEPVTPQAIPPQNLAHEAFAHGNTYLAEGKFAEATAAFHQASELNPKHPHVAGRLAEVERRQRAARVITPTA
jgi:predicted negative regulator of RcsB-dependent stress response